MNFAEPIWALGTAALPFLLLLAVWAARRQMRGLAQLFRGEMLARILPKSLIFRRRVGLLLWTLGLALVFVALAEPRYGKEVREVERKGVDIVLAVDLSRSMLAEDVEPSRLGRAQRELYDLIEMLDGDRIGLVIYAGGAYGRMPLTLDYDAFELLVRELDTSTFSAQGSALGGAIRESMRLLGEDEGTGRAILVLSDGEVHDAADALAAAQEARDAAVRVYALGIGDAPAPIPLRDGRSLTWKGETVLSTPSADVLRDVAKATGGAYVQSTASVDDMQRLYQHEIRRSLEARATGTSQKETWRSAFQAPLGLGMLAILLGVVLGESRRAALVLVALFIAMPAHAASVIEGDEAYRAGRYGEAVSVFTELAGEQPGNAELWDRLGASRYRAKDFEGAARAYDRAARLSDNIESTFSAGNAHYQAGRLDEALQRYDDVLTRQPGHPGARRNRAILIRELEDRRLQDPPPPPKPEPEQGEEGEEGEQSEEGEQGEQGEEGEPGDQGEEGEASQAQPGEGQEGSSEEGGSEGETQDGVGSGDPQDNPEQQGGGASQSDGTDRSGEQAQGEPGEEPGEGEGELESLEALEGEGEGEEEGAVAGQGASDGAGEEGGPMTEAQAERMLEGVEEGRPRVVIPGGRAENPW